MLHSHTHDPIGVPQKTTHAQIGLAKYHPLHKQDKATMSRTLQDDRSDFCHGTAVTQ